MRLGSIATGSDFFDRVTECKDLWNYLENEHIVASGPRRLGKSSIVNRLREQALEQELLAQHVDVQGVEGAQAFVDQLAAHFPDATVNGYITGLTQTAKQWFAKVKKVGLKGPGGLGADIELHAAVSQPWYKSATALQARLTGIPALIFIDEFSVFLDKLLERDQKEAVALLAWLRAWRVTPGVACRFLFTGSIGLNSLLAKHGLSAQFNDCHEYPIGPFKPTAAQNMVKQFAPEEGHSISDDTAAHLCQRVGWLSPYYLCLLLNEAKHTARDRIEENQHPTLPTTTQGLVEITATDVDNAYERLLSARSRFIHWEERLRRDLAGLDLSFATLILTALAKNQSGLTQRQLHARLAKLEPDPDTRAARLQTILGRLQEEGYVSPTDAAGRVEFLSFLLRDYWRRNHV